MHGYGIVKYMPAKISSDRERLIASMYDDGLSIKNIMKSLGHSQRVVVRAIHTYSTMRPPTVSRTLTDKFLSLDSQAAYWLGFIAADGHLRSDGHRHELIIEVNKKDELHIDRLMGWLGFGTKIFRKRDACVIFIFSSKSLIENLSQWIPVGNKTEHDNFSSIPHDNKIDFARGYFDGDGSTNGRQFSITSCRETLIPLSNFIGKTVGEQARVYQKRNNRAMSAHWNKDATKQFFEKFNGSPRLERKWNENIV